jgi:predicted Zn finger-like uncharacterized protein
MTVHCQKCDSNYKVDYNKISSKGAKAKCPKCENLSVIKQTIENAPSLPAEDSKINGEISFSTIFLRQSSDFYSSAALGSLQRRWLRLSNDVDNVAKELEDFEAKFQTFKDFEKSYSAERKNLENSVKKIEADNKNEQNLVEDSYQAFGELLLESHEKGLLASDDIFVAIIKIKNTISSLQNEKNGSDSATGFLGKAKALAQEKLIDGKIFLEKMNLNSELSKLGEEIISKNLENNHYNDITKNIIDKVAISKKQIESYENGKKLIAEKQKRLEIARKEKMVELDIGEPAKFLSEAENIKEEFADLLDELNEESIDLFHETYISLNNMDLVDSELKECIEKYSKSLDELAKKRDDYDPAKGKIKRNLTMAGLIGFGAFNLISGGVPMFLVAGAGGLAAAKGTKWVRSKTNKKESALCLCYRCDNPGPHYFNDIARSSTASVAIGFVGGALGGLISTLMAGKLFQCRKCGAILKDSGQSVWLADEAIKHFMDYPELHENLVKLQHLIAAKDENIKELVRQHNDEINQFEQAFCRQKLSKEELSQRVIQLTALLQEGDGQKGEQLGTL